MAWASSPTLSSGLQSRLFSAGVTAETPLADLASFFPPPFQRPGPAPAVPQEPRT